MKPIPAIDLSHYRPTPESRRFSISTFSITGRVNWAAKAGGAFEARVEVIKGALAKLIPFQTLESSVHVESGTKVFSLQTVGGNSGESVKEKRWNDVGVLSPIEIPWVAEYALRRRDVGGPNEVSFQFEDNQRVRHAILCFQDDKDADMGDATALLRVLKLDEQPRSLVESEPNGRAGDVAVTFREGKIVGFTVLVPIVGKLRFVSES